MSSQRYLLVLRRLEEWSNMMQWPKKMEHGPDHYLKQADKFLDFVCGLLSMRNIPLQTKTEPEDGLLHLNHSIKTVHQKSFDDAASEWLTSVQLTSKSTLTLY